MCYRTVWQGCTNPGSTLLWHPNFVQLDVLFWGPQFGTSFMSSFRCLEYRGTARSLENFCTPAIRFRPDGCFMHQQTTVAGMITCLSFLQCYIVCIESLQLTKHGSILQSHQQVISHGVETSGSPRKW
jgi:hypothetical protein